MILGFLGLIFTLILVVGIHELGHAFAARIWRVKIQKISLGFGRPLLTWKDKNDSEWVLAILPLGGYVKLLNSRIQAVDPANYSSCFDKKSLGARALILVAGVFANLLTAWLALTFMFFLGYFVKTPVIKSVTPGSIAEQSGFKAGDRIEQIANEKISSWQAVGMEILMHTGQEKIMILASDSTGKMAKMNLNLSQWRLGNDKKNLFESLGIIPDKNENLVHKTLGKSLLQSAYQSMKTVGYLLYFFLIIIKQLLTGVLPFSWLAGPLTFLEMSIHSLLQGVAVFFYFIANLSLAVALVNLLPIPGLDGCSLLYLAIEKIRGKPLSLAFEILLYRLAMIFFCVIFIQLLMHDIKRYLS